MKKDLNCRITKKNQLVKILDLGLHPPPNLFKKKISNKITKYPLTLFYCKCCSNIQISETVNKDLLFKNYFWVTGTSELVQKYANIFLKKIINISKSNYKDLIIEVGSNDGTFLNSLIKKKYLNVLGVDPAKNLTNEANKNNINTINSFWDLKTSIRIKKKYGKAKVIFARNVIPHVSDLHSVMEGIKNILDNYGYGFIEFHSAHTILNKLQYDSIYHEHLNYFSLLSINKLLSIYNLYIFDVFTSPMNGGSLCVCFSKNKNKLKSTNYYKQINLEKKIGVNKITKWKKFEKDVIDHKINFLKILNNYKSKKIIGYGASARAQTFINFCDISVSNIKLIIDNNPLKHKKFTPKNSIPIVSLKDGLKTKPDIIVLLAWNFEKEIINSLKKNGFKGKIIRPFPNKIKTYLI